MSGGEASVAGHGVSDVGVFAGHREVNDSAAKDALQSALVGDWIAGV